MSNNESAIREMILSILDENDGEIHGTEKLTKRLYTSKRWTLACVRVLQNAGQLTIIPSRGGRGNRTIYKRNVDSPRSEEKQKTSG